MKQIINWRKATVADLEATGLYYEADRLHVLSLQMQKGDIRSIDGSDLAKLRTFFEWHIDTKTPVVFHNGICFDIPLCEKLLEIDLSELMVIDTLALSWYLNVDRKKHGLGEFFDDYGIKKPEVGEEEWVIPEQAEGESDEEYQMTLLHHQCLMYYRCQEDVAINKALWEDLKERLIDMYSLSKLVIDSGTVGGKRLSEDEVMYLDQFRNKTSVDEWIDMILTFLMYKMDNVRIKEATLWEADVPAYQKLHDDLTVKIEEARAILEGVMPPVPKYVDKKFPKKPTRKGKKGEPDVVLSATGSNWNELMSQMSIVNDFGHKIVKQHTGSPYAIDPEYWSEGDGEDIKVKMLQKYEPPKVSSPEQIKSFLFSHGWVPQTFDFKDDKEAMDSWFASGCRGKKPAPRKIPQVSRKGDEGKELCPSVIKLADDVPEIMAYQKYTTIKHRRDMVKGFLENLIDGKYLAAGCQGFTNTLREQHRGLVNLPGVDKPYGKEIRGGLICSKGQVLLGSDLSSLEDRVKHHFMLPHDPEYVEAMMEPDYDPHIYTALFSKMITQEEYEDFKAGMRIAHVVKARKAGKETNYASVYSAGAATIARSAGVSLEKGKELHAGYWELNWSVKSIAEEQVVITCSKGKSWLVNPLNGFCYSLRGSKDRFSTLCQGTGSFIFDMWIDNVLNSMYSEFKVKRLNFLAHDEYVTTFRDTPFNRERMSSITEESIGKVNEKYLLRRDMGCDIQYGKAYSEIH